MFNRHRATIALYFVSALASQCFVFCDISTRADSSLLERVSALESKVKELSEQLKSSQSDVAHREAHIAHLLSLLSAKVDTLSNESANCPIGTMPVRTNTNPPHEICVQVRPHALDAAMVNGGWGTCSEIRDWVVLVAQAALDPDLRWTFLDVGANIGMCSLYLAMLSVSRWDERDILGGQGSHVARVPFMDVAAIEPDPLHAAMIRASAKLNYLDHIVSVHERVAWDSSGQTLQYHRQEFINSAASYVTPNGNHSFAEFDARSADSRTHGFMEKVYAVPTLALDELLAEALRAHRPIVMKADIETTEMFALRGARAALNADLIWLIHFEYDPHLRLDGVSGLELLLFLRENRFILYCPLHCAGSYPSVGDAPIEDLVGFSQLQFQRGALNLVAVHRNVLVAPYEVNAAPNMARAINLGYRVRNQVRVH